MLSWIVIRILQRSMKHFQQAYIEMDLRNELMVFGQMRMFAFYVLYPLEVLNSYLLVNGLYQKAPEALVINL